MGEDNTWLGHVLHAEVHKNTEADHHEHGVAHQVHYREGLLGLEDEQLRRGRQQHRILKSARLLGRLQVVQRRVHIIGLVGPALSADIDQHLRLVGRRKIVRDRRSGDCRGPGGRKCLLPRRVYHLLSFQRCIHLESALLVCIGEVASGREEEEHVAAVVRAYAESNAVLVPCEMVPWTLAPARMHAIVARKRTATKSLVDAMVCCGEQ